MYLSAKAKKTTSKLELLSSFDLLGPPCDDALLTEDNGKTGGKGKKLRMGMWSPCTSAATYNFRSR